MEHLPTVVVLDLAEAVRLSRTGEGRSIREAAGVPQTAVGAAVGVKASTVHRWESGERTPTGDAAVQWVRLLRLLAGSSRPGTGVMG
jgi:DNA-binding transcriptional regulator YiaG